MADDTKTAKPDEVGETTGTDEPSPESSSAAPNADKAAELAAELRTQEPTGGIDDGQGGDRGDRDDEFSVSDLNADGIDPDLITLPRKSTIRIGPVMSISVLVFCFYIIVKVYPDLRFSRSSDRPTHYDSVQQLFAEAEPEELVSINAVPDRSFAVHVSHSKADDGSRLTPTQGSDGALWLLIGGNVWNTSIDYSELYAGRLRRLADMPFYENLQEHIRERGPEPRFVRAKELKAALESARSADQPVILREPAGDRIALRSDTPVQIYETLADRVRIHIFPTERMPKKSDLVGALQASGLVPEGYEPERGLALTDSWIFVVDVPGGVAAARARLREHKLFSARCTPVKRLHESEFGTLKSTPELLTIGANLVLWKNVTWVSVDVPRTVPDDALVLLTMEHPATYWYVLPLFVFLALAILFFLFALFRSFKPA